MTGVPPETPPENIAEEVPPSERPDPEEYAPDEEVSTDTGTRYGEEGEAETTPHDLETTDEDELEAEE